jgi:hypothetical protein
VEESSENVIVSANKKRHPTMVMNDGEQQEVKATQ